MGKTLKPPPVDSAGPSIADLVNDPANRRKHTTRNLRMVVDALQQVGAARSIVIDEDNVILAGNGVTAAAAEAGLTKLRIIEAAGDELIAVRRSGLTDKQKRDLALFDNRTAELAEWNIEQLTADLRNGEDLTAFFLPAELRALMPAATTAGRTDADDVPEPRRTSIVAGDLFELGRHRLLCGDSTIADAVVRITERPIDLLFTDPPYGVAYQTNLSVEDAVALHRRKDGLEVANDAMTADQTRAFVALALRTVTEHLKPGGVFYVCSPSGDMELHFRLALLDAGLALREVIAWVKDVFVMGRQDYHWRHETILYGWKAGAGHYFVDDRTQDTVWECARPKRSAEHPTMKPVALVARAIQNSSRDGELVCDPFSGGGSTLMACEQYNRVARVIEIAPLYCQVAIDRWEAFTGAKALKVGEAVSA